MINITQELSGIIEGKEKIPIGFVEVYDTTYTVPSNGFFVRYYSGVNPNLSGSIRRTQFEPILLKDWSNGIPVELSNYIGANVTNSGLWVSDPFSVVYSGYFYAQKSGLYTFATRSNGGVEMYVNNAQVLSGYQILSPGLTGYSSGIWDNKNYYWEGKQTLNTGWYDFKLNFYWFAGITTGINASPFLTAFYTAPNEPQRVISASVVNYQNSFLSPLNIPNVINFRETFDEDLSAQFDFEVAVIKSGDYEWNKAREDFGNLKINRLCHIYQGYVTESGYFQTSGYTTNIRNANGLIRKFTGFIDNISTAQTSNSFTSTVRCRDFFKKLRNAINENYPNRANYTPTVTTGVDKFGVVGIDQTMPNAYDNWPIFNVIETVALNGGIDPIHLNRDKWDTSNHFQLESNLNWPFTSTYDINGIETKNGDPFIFKFSYGEILADEIKKVSDLIGYNSYFDQFGDMVVKEPRRTNRVEIYESGNYGSKSVFYSGTWTTTVDVNSSNRFYISPIQNGSYTTGVFRLTFSGVGFGAYYHTHPSGSPYYVRIYDDATNNLVFVNSGYTTSGLNKYGVLHEYTRNLPYAKYNAFIYPVSGNWNLEGTEYYTQNIFKPVYTLKDDRDIISLSVDLNDYSVRNEVITVGQQISDKGYIYSKAIDLDSISNPSAFNYVGEKRTITIVEPTIQSQSRLDWLAKNILEKYRRKQRNISVTTQGLPHIQIGDPVGIKSDKMNFNSDVVSTYDIDNQEVYYVTNISSSLSQGNYQSTLTLTSLKPIESWRPPIAITTDMLRRIYESNGNTIFANFRQDTLNSILPDYGYDGFSEQGAFVSFDMLVDVDRLWVLVGDTNDGGNLFKAIDTRSKNPFISYIPGQKDIPQGGVWLHNAGGEKWGRVTVPTAQNSFNGGQWAGQNSQGNVRLDGTYPVAIWAQFRTADNQTYFQGIWIPTSGTLDNRNRVDAFTTTSNSNFFVAYSNNPNLPPAIPSPVTATTTLAKLPGFVVKNSPISIDLFLGPINSGIQFVRNNRLTSLSGLFSYQGDAWNYPQFAPSGVYFDSGIINTTIIATGLYPGTSIVGTKTLGASADGPWKTGDNIVFEGPALALDTIQNFLTKKINRLSPTPTLPEITDVSRTGVIGKQIYGWSPMAFNTIPAFPGYPYNMSPTTGPGYGVNFWNSPAPYPQSVFNDFNYITLRTNRDLYLTMEAVIFSISRVGSWEPVQTYVPGSSSKAIGSWTTTVQYQVGSATRFVWSTINLNVPFRAPLAIYPSDWHFKRSQVAGAAVFFNPQTVAPITAQSNYIMGTTPIENWAIPYHYEPFVLYRFTLTEAKSGRKYNFTFRGFGMPFGIGKFGEANAIQKLVQ